MSGRRRLRTAMTLLVVGLVAVPASVGAAAPDAAASHESGANPAFIVDVRADGAAEVTVRYAFDLSEPSRAEAFEQLKNNETVQQEFVTAFRSRMQSVVNGTEAATGRDMSLGDASIAFRTVDSTGVVELSVTVEGLAAVKGDRVVLTEPFASGFQPERQFRVVLPDGYEVASVTPDPSGQSDGELYWSAGTSLDGFELVMADAGGETPADTPAATEPDGDGAAAGTTPGGGSPGFGVAATVAALVAALALAASRRRR